MSNFELIRFSGDVELARAAASDWLKEVETANHRESFHGVALSGGRIARRFFSSVVEQAKARKVSFAPVHFFWADERCVLPGDPESNLGVARQFLLSPLEIRDSHVHRIRAEGPEEFAVAEAEAELRRLAPLNDAGQPVLDLIFLGMGEDGHVASLFPGEPKEIAAAKTVYRAVVAPKPPARRITIGYSVLAAARQVWVLASGAGKQGVLRHSLSPEGQTPLAEVLRLRQRTRIYTDSPV
jgi:6-phosphogluconolactonase